MMTPITRERDAIIKPTAIRKLGDSVVLLEMNENRKIRLNEKPITPIETPTNLF